MGTKESNVPRAAARALLFVISVVKTEVWEPSVKRNKACIQVHFIQTSIPSYNLILRQTMSETINHS